MELLIGTEQCMGKTQGLRSVVPSCLLIKRAWCNFIRTPGSDDRVLGHDRQDGRGLAACVWRREVWSLVATSGKLGLDHPVGNLANKTCHAANNVAKEWTIKPRWILTPPLLCDLKKKKEFVFQVSLNLNWSFFPLEVKGHAWIIPTKMARVQLAT